MVGLRYWSITSEAVPSWCASGLDVIAHPEGANGFAAMKCGELAERLGGFPTDLKVVIGKQPVGCSFE